MTLLYFTCGYIFMNTLHRISCCWPLILPVTWSNANLNLCLLWENQWRSLLHFTGRVDLGGGGVYRNHRFTLSVCLSIYLFTSCPGLHFLPSCPIWIIFHIIIVHDPRMCISYKCCPWPKGVSWPWPKVIPSRSMSQCTHSKINVRAITPHYHVGCWWYFTKLLSMTQGCVMTLTQGQGHSAFMHKICVRAITPLCHVGSG